MSKRTSKPTNKPASFVPKLVFRLSLASTVPVLAASCGDDAIALAVIAFDAGPDARVDGATDAATDGPVSSDAETD